MGHNFSFCQTCETPLDCDCCDKLVALIEPGCMTLEELKAEAKRQGYKLIKATRPRFERCLCGYNVHQWVSGPKGWAVYCKHCGLESPWAKKSHSAVIEAWNAMILEIRQEQTNGRDQTRHVRRPRGSEAID